MISMSKKTSRKYVQVDNHRFYDLEQWQIDYIKEHWNEKNGAIAGAVNLPEKQISRIGMTLGMPKKATGYNVTEGIDIGGHHYKYVTQEQFEYIKEHFEDQVSDIAEAIGLDSQRVSDIIIRAGLRDRLYKRFIPEDPKGYNDDLKDPYLSHAELGKKYGVSESLIALHRKQRGYGVRRKNYDTIPELVVTEILDELDLAYIHPKQIGKWSIDFYLGNKVCIDVNGSWSHSLDHVIERDTRKNIELREQGYKYLIIDEVFIKDKELVKNAIIDIALGFPLPEKVS
jgi:G:T-mismatch repair DNA endonuclease (very short patch repair protein)